ncbi:MAG: hypothetical protein WC732_05470 [Candidatus Omnitrophota bacterium]
MKRLLLVFFLVLILVKGAWASEPKENLEIFRQRMMSVFDMLAEESRTAADRLNSVGISEDETRSVLKDLCGGLSYAEDCAFIDTNGILKYVEPADYRSVEGKDISGQEQFQRLKDTKKPVFSDVFKSVEGFDSLDYEHPVFDEGGNWQGAVSVLMKPAHFIDLALRADDGSLPYEIMVVRRDGFILYADPAEIGKNIFTNPLYQGFPSLTKLFKKVVKDESGEGVFNFVSRKTGEPVKKKAYWSTVKSGENLWRVLLIVE